MYPLKRFFSKIKQWKIKRWLPALPLAMVFLSAPAANGAPGNDLKEYRLRLFHTHTGERLNIYIAGATSILLERLINLIITCATIEPAMSTTMIHASSTCCTI